MKSFWLELKSNCKSIRFLAFILVLLSFQAMYISRFHSESVGVMIRETRSHERYSSESSSFVDYWQTRYDYLQEHGKPNPLDPYSPQMIEYNLGWYQYEKLLGNKIYQAFLTKDWSTYTRYMAEKRLLEWRLHVMMRDASTDYSNPRNRPLPPHQLYFGQDWAVYSPLIEEFEFDRMPAYVGERMKMAMDPDNTIMSTAYLLHLLKEDLPPMNHQDTSPWGFLFNFMRYGLPAILGLIVLLMTVNLLHRDKKSGSIKSTLQLPKSRVYYLLRKVGLGFVTSISVVAIPLFLMFMGLGVKHGYRGLTHPVIIDNGFLNTSVSADHILYFLKDTFTLKLGLSQYNLPWSIFIPGLDRLEFIPLWQFLLLAAALLALFILFCTVLGILISTLIKNDILAQIIAVVIFGLGTAFDRIFPNLSTTPWDLFSKANVIPLLEGSHYSTYLNSAITLGIGTILLFGVTAVIFRKQDIVA